MGCGSSKKQQPPADPQQMGMVPTGEIPPPSQAGETNTVGDVPTQAQETAPATTAVTAADVTNAAPQPSAATAAAGAELKLSDRQKTEFGKTTMSQGRTVIGTATTVANPPSLVLAPTKDGKAPVAATLQQQQPAGQPAAAPAPAVQPAPAPVQLQQAPQKAPAAPVAAAPPPAKPAAVYIKKPAVAPPAAVQPAPAPAPVAPPVNATPPDTKGKVVHVASNAAGYETLPPMQMPEQN